MGKQGVHQPFVGGHALHLPPTLRRVRRQHFVEAARVQSVLGPLAPVTEQVGGVLVEVQGHSAAGGEEIRARNQPANRLARQALAQASGPGLLYSA